MRTTHARTGQVILEGVLLWVIIAIVLIGMAVFFQRAIRGRIFSTANQVGEQFTPGQNYSMESRFSSARNEAVGTSGDIANSTWSSSTIRKSLPDPKDAKANPLNANGDRTKFIKQVGGVLDVANGGKGYGQAEVQSEDFVTQADAVTVGDNGRTLGKHDVMDSGKLSGAKLFTEDTDPTPKANAQ